MKFECAKVPRHDQFVVTGLAVVTTVVAWRVGAHYGWKGHDPSLAADAAIVFSVAGFLAALFCILSVPLNKVNYARLAVGAVFVSYAYAFALMVHGLEITDRVSRVALYLFVAVVAFPWLAVEKVRTKEVKP